MIYFRLANYGELIVVLNRILFTIIVSRWTVLIEMLFILIPTTVIALFSPFGIIFVPDLPAFVIVILLSVIGLIALWRLLFSLQEPDNPPIWVFFGLLLGLVAAVRAIFVIPIALLLYGPSIFLAAHWFWLHKENALNRYKL